MTTANAQVLRDGEHLILPATEIVPGDIVLLEAGNLIPADLRLVETAQLKVDEALLTGESATVEKHSKHLSNPELPLADRTNMAFKGTAATNGRGRGLVIATGMATELGICLALSSVVFSAWSWKNYWYGAAFFIPGRTDINCFARAESNEGIYQPAV